MDKNEKTGSAKHTGPLSDSSAKKPKKTIAEPRSEFNKEAIKWKIVPQNYWLGEGIKWFCEDCW